jgi:2-methylisocitrate lyase-like PEP mutase family enzyme
MDPADLVAALTGAGAAGCNLEDTDHATGTLRDPARHAEWLGSVRQAASDSGYGLVINARIDVFLSDVLSGSDRGTQGSLVPEALRRAHAYLDAGADCVFPIGLWEAGALRSLIAEAAGPVNALGLPRAPSLPELAGLGVARVSYGTLLHRGAMEEFGRVLGWLAAAPA